MQGAGHADHHQRGQYGQQAATDLPAPAPDKGGHAETGPAKSRYGLLAD